MLFTSISFHAILNYCFFHCLLILLKSLCSILIFRLCHLYIFNRTYQFCFLCTLCFIIRLFRPLPVNIRSPLLRLLYDSIRIFVNTAFTSLYLLSNSISPSMNSISSFFVNLICKSPSEIKRQEQISNTKLNIRFES